jgi:hypothetical protein
MNGPGLRSLLERATADVEGPPRMGTDAWDAARRRARRTAVAAVAATALVIGGATAAVVVTETRHDESTPPVKLPNTPTASTSPTTVHSSVPAYLPHGPVADYRHRLQAVTQTPWSDAEIDSLPRLDNLLPSQLEPFASSVTATLADDPVARALAVAQRRGSRTLDLRVLGSDGRWRVLDTSQIRLSYSDSSVVSVVSGSPLSPDGSRLAVPERGAVVIVDLHRGVGRGRAAD